MCCVLCALDWSVGICLARLPVFVDKILVFLCMCLDREVGSLIINVVLSLSPPSPSSAHWSGVMPVSKEFKTE